MTPPASFRSDYLAALQRHVRRGNEATLRAGYELGRRAVSEGVSALELAGLHHDALETSLRSGSGAAAPDVVTAAGAFFQEILSAFEMVHRGYREASAAAAAERRNAAMLRRLSSFLADASLGARDDGALAEVVHLVAEHARELTDAGHCVARCTLGTRRVRGTSSDEDAPAREASGTIERIEAVADALPARVARSEWSGEPALRPALRNANRALSILTVPIAALDGRRLGFLQLVDKRSGDFTDVDEAVALHLAEMTAASLERAELYRGAHTRTV